MNSISNWPGHHDGHISKIALEEIMEKHIIASTKKIKGLMPYRVKVDKFGQFFYFYELAGTKTIKRPVPMGLSRFVCKSCGEVYFSIPTILNSNMIIEVCDECQNV